MFRFTICELVLVTALVAMGAGWYADRHAIWWRWAIAKDRESTLKSYLSRRGVTVNYIGPHSVSIGPRSDSLPVAKQFHESEN